MQRCLQSDTSQFMSLINSCLQLTVEMVTCLALATYLFHTSHSITVVIGVLLLLCIGLFFMISKKVSSRLGRQNERYNAKTVSVDQSVSWRNQGVENSSERRIFIDSYKTNYKKLIWGARVNELISALPKIYCRNSCHGRACFCRLLSNF